MIETRIISGSWAPKVQENMNKAYKEGYNLEKFDAVEVSGLLYYVVLMIKGM